MDFREKLERLLSHWVEHNDAHIEEIEKWVAEAEQNGEQEMADALGACAEAMQEVGDRLEDALGLLLSMEDDDE